MIPFFYAQLFSTKEKLSWISARRARPRSITRSELFTMRSLTTMQEKPRLQRYALHPSDGEERSFEVGAPQPTPESDLRPP